MQVTHEPSISGARLQVLIVNAHTLLRHNYRRTPLWVMIRDLTGAGSSTSMELCRQLCLDPHGACGGYSLKRLAAAPNKDVICT